MSRENPYIPTLEEIEEVVAQLDVGRTYYMYDEIKLERCPYCHNGSHDDKNKAYINKTTGVFYCHRGSCEANTGRSFVRLAADFNIKLRDQLARERELAFAQPRQQRKQKNKDAATAKTTTPAAEPQATPTAPVPREAVNYTTTKTYAATGIATTQRAIDYMSSRGIPEEVTRAYKITTGRDKHANDLVEPCISPDGATVELIKYRPIQRRDGQPKETCEAGMSVAALFGAHLCDPVRGPLVITEGQIDAMSLAAAGVTNCISVARGKMDDKWINKYYDWVMSYPGIVIFGDCEANKAGKYSISLVDIIAKRFSPSPTFAIKVVRIEDYIMHSTEDGRIAPYKDANDILRAAGPAALRKAVANAQAIGLPKIDGVISYRDIKRSYELNPPHWHTGIYQLDRRIKGLYPGQLIVISAKSGAGKSTLMSQICCNTLDEVVSDGRETRIFAYSGEATKEQFKGVMDSQLTGAATIKLGEDEYGDGVYATPPVVGNMIDDWCGDRIWKYDNLSLACDKRTEAQRIIDKAVELIQRYGVNIICVDNLMTAIDVTDDGDVYTAQTNFVRQLKIIAVRYSVVVILVAHPRKTQGNVHADDIAGTSNITNLADTVITFSRLLSPGDLTVADRKSPPPESMMADEYHNDGIWVRKCRKNGYVTPENEPIRVMYHTDSLRITGDGPDDNPLPSRVYGWVNASRESQWVPVTDANILPF